AVGPVHSPVFQGHGAPQQLASLMPDIMIPVGTHVGPHAAHRDAPFSATQNAYGQHAPYDPDGDVEAGLVTEGDESNEGDENNEGGANGRGDAGGESNGTVSPLPTLPPSSLLSGSCTDESPPQIVHRVPAQCPEDATLF
ncbi:MAG: hypothetical protein VX446_02935, partial [Bacteroidota bacterium]|nr:hypothetical protein [Bacteroidota bacterium]